MLFELVSLSDQINALNVFRYITFRTGGAIMTALLFVLLFGPAIILQRRIVRPAVALSAVLGLAAFASGNAIIAAGLHIPNIPAVAEPAVMCGAIVGAGIACLAKESDGCCLSW